MHEVRKDPTPPPQSNSVSTQVPCDNGYGTADVEREVTGGGAAMSLSGFVWETETGPSTTAQLGPPFVRERPATGRFAHRHDPCMHPLPSAAAIGPSAVQHGIDTRICASERVCEWCKLHFATTCPPHPLPLDAGFAVNLLLLVASPDSNQGRGGDFRLLRACVSHRDLPNSCVVLLIIPANPPQAVTACVSEMLPYPAECTGRTVLQTGGKKLRRPIGLDCFL